MAPRRAESAAGVRPYCTRKRPSARTLIPVRDVAISGEPSSLSSTHVARNAANANEPAHASSTNVTAKETRTADEERRAENRRRDRRRVGLVRPEQVPLEQDREALDVRAERLLRARAGVQRARRYRACPERGAGHARRGCGRVRSAAVLRAVPRARSRRSTSSREMLGLDRALKRPASAAADVPHQTARHGRDAPSQ